MVVSIQLRRDTSANWTNHNPILKNGEPGREADSGRFKYGDGVTTWNNLTYSDYNKVNITDIVNNLTAGGINKPGSAEQLKILKGLIDNINTLLTSNDTTLDDLQEVVNFIKQNKTDLQNLGINNIAGLQNILNTIGIVGTKTVNELTIGDGKILEYNQLSGQLVYVNKPDLTPYMIRSRYDINNSGIVDNAELVNGLTIQTAVPAGAMFTDTVYDDTLLQAQVTTNNIKVSNKTHTGEIIGSGPLTIQPLAISNKPLKITTGIEEILINDAGILRKTTAQSIANLNGINKIIEDVTPTLGGALNVNGQIITSTNNGNVLIKPHGTGNFSINTDQLIVNSSTNNVGIGTATPFGKLHIVDMVGDSTSRGFINLTAISGSAALRIGLNTNYTWIQSHGSRPFHINELGNNTIFNLQGGNVGIGNISPSHKLDIEVNNGATSPYFRAINRRPGWGGGVSFASNNGSGTIRMLNSNGGVTGSLISTTGGWQWTSQFNIMGRAGIGINIPRTMLDVNGAITVRSSTVPADPIIQSLILYQDSTNSNLMCKITDGTTTKIVTIIDYSLAI